MEIAVVRNAEMIDAVSVAAYRKNGDVDFFFGLGRRVSSGTNGVFSWEMKIFWVPHRMFYGISKRVFGY
jgi:hypothetical protein